MIHTSNNTGYTKDVTKVVYEIRTEDYAGASVCTQTCTHQLNVLPFSLHSSLYRISYVHPLIDNLLSEFTWLYKCREFSPAHIKSNDGKNYKTTAGYRR